MGINVQLQSVGQLPHPQYEMSYYPKIGEWKKREFSHRQSRVQRVRKSPSCVYIPCVHLLQKEVRRITCLWWPYTKMTSKNSLAACLIMWEGRGQAPYRRACSYSRRWGQHASLVTVPSKAERGPLFMCLSGRLLPSTPTSQPCCLNVSRHPPPPPLLH